MKKIQNKALLLIVLMITMLLSAVLVLGVTPKVYDKAQLFSSAELEALESRANELSERLQLDIVIVTTNENEDKTSRAYADDFYDQNGFGYGTEADGVLLLINMEDREVYISTCGKAIQYLTDARTQNILDKIYISLGDEYYKDAAETFLKQLEYYVAEGIPQNQNTQFESSGTVPVRENTLGNTYTSQKTTLSMEQKLLIYLLISFAVGGISVGIMAMNNRGVSTTNQSTYLRDNALNIYNKQDQHVNTTVTHVTIQTDSGSSSSAGRSTVHRSSSGRTHGGGGRKF